MPYPGGNWNLCRLQEDTHPTYEYRVPQKTNDGWDTASLAAENIDPGPIQTLFDRIHDGSYKNVHSVLVVKNGNLVIEEYFPGKNSNQDFRRYDRDKTHELASVTKTITSICAGIAIDQQLIGSTDERVSTLFPQYVSPHFLNLVLLSTS